MSQYNLWHFIHPGSQAPQVSEFSVEAESARDALDSGLHTLLVAALDGYVHLPAMLHAERDTDERDYSYTMVTQEVADAYWERWRAAHQSN